MVFLFPSIYSIWEDRSANLTGHSRRVQQNSHIYQPIAIKRYENFSVDIEYINIFTVLHKVGEFAPCSHGEETSYSK